MKGSVLRVVLLLALGATIAAVAATASARAASLPWCGSGEPTSDAADAVNAFEWHVVYATASGGIDRFGDYAPRIAGDVQTMSNWWLGQDSTRRLRFDLLDAPGCSSESGRVDISLVRVPPADVTFDSVVRDVRAAGFQSPDKGYLVYFDGTPHAGDEFGVCGEGGTDRTAFAYSVVFLQTCNQASSDDIRELVATHEMVHGMGAVSSQAPHACNSGHVCDSSSDLMKAVIGNGDSLASLSLDVGRDDYYGHAGPWSDVQDSKLLYDLDRSLDPAPEIVALTATSRGALVRVNWKPAASQPGLTYRIYDEQGRLLVGGQSTTTTTSTGALGEVVVRTIRTVNPYGFLSRAATIRFKVGYGTVDATGNLLQDTVPPNAVRSLRGTASRTQLVLRWARVADPLGLRGYRVSSAGMRPLLVAGTSARLPLARVRGKRVSVAAVDRAGNVGSKASVRVRR